MFVIQSKLNNSVEKFEIRNYLIELLLEGNNSREHSHGLCQICLLTHCL